MDSIKKYFSEKDFERLQQAKNYYHSECVCFSFSETAESVLESSCIFLNDFLGIFNLYHKKHRTGIDVTIANEWFRDILFDGCYNIGHISEVKGFKIIKKVILEGQDHSNFFGDPDDGGPAILFFLDVILATEASTRER